MIEKNFVLYKLIDLNNIAVFTEGTSKIDEKLFFVYILNTKTGRILYKTKVSGVNRNLPINLLADDNSFLLAYTSTVTKKTEIKHIELFRKQLEKDFWPILTEKMWEKDRFLEEIDYNSKEDQFYVLEKNYGIDVNVKKMLAFDSLNDLTSKDIMLIT